MDTCDGVEYTTTIEKGKYGSDWFDCDVNWDEGDAIAKFIKEHLKKDGKAQKPCEGDCDVLSDKKKKTEYCRPVGIEIHVVHGKAKLKRAETEIDHDTYCSYILVVSEDSTIKVKTRCRCLKSLDPPKSDSPDNK